MKQLSFESFPSPPQRAIEMDGETWRFWFYQLWDTIRGLDAMTVNNLFQTVRALDMEGTRFAGEAYSSGSTIQAAIDAASPNGSVIIPASYTGTDSYNNEDNIPVLDFRNQQLGVWSWICPSFPTNSPVLGQFPLGNDLNLMTRGPADTYLSKQTATCATASNLVVGANTVTVGAVECKDLPHGTTVTGTLRMFALAAGLFVGRGTANEEVVSAGNYTINSDTSITLTCANPHTGPVDIEQVGTVFLTSPEIIIDPKGVPAPNSTFYRLTIYDSDRNVIGYLPYLGGNPWPYAGVAFNAFITGAQGANQDLALRMALNTSNLLVYDNTAGFIRLQLQNNGNLAIGGSMLVNSTTLIGSTTTLSDGAGAAVGTLNNAPTAGNPTKWIQINDNGTIRNIPSWT